MILCPCLPPPPPPSPCPFPSIWSCAFPPFCPLSSRGRSGLERRWHGPRRFRPGSDGFFPPTPKGGRGPAGNVPRPVLLLTTVGPNHKWVRVLEPTVMTGQLCQLSPGGGWGSAQLSRGLGNGAATQKWVRNRSTEYGWTSTDFNASKLALMSNGQPHMASEGAKVTGEGHAQVTRGLSFRSCRSPTLSTAESRGHKVIHFPLFPSILLSEGASLAFLPRC